ncbi:MAG: transporter substrate-binding domain-containing protein, partial [Desulfobulbaceae bacterium]|nr:transporter substrate-binding domain-containing protein [Desulfobulbaceae bacterium]
MNNKIKILFFILAIILLFTPSTVLSDNRTIKVSQSKNPPLIFSDQEGNPQGIFVDIISEIASQEGWKLEFVPCTWSECQQKLETGELNLLMSVASSEERRAKFDFSEEQVFSNWGTIYRKSHSNLESIHDLEGEKIAVVKGNIHTKAFRNLLKEFSVESEIVEVKDYPDVAALVDAGNVSAGVFNRVNGLKYEGEFTLERTHIIFNPVKLLFASPKGKNHELLSIIDSTLKEWKKDQDSVYYESLNKWLGITPKRYIPKWLYFSLIIICGVLIISSGWTYVLRKQINERKKIEQALLQSKEEWEKTFNAITDIVTLQDLDMKIVKVNKTGCDTLGLPCENIIGKHCYELFHGSHEPCPGCPLLVTQETFEPYTKEMRHEKLVKTFLVSAAPVVDDQGNLTHISHVAKDITEKKK